MKYSSENEILKGFAKKSSPKLSYKTLLQSPLINLNWKNNKKYRICILHGSRSARFVLNILIFEKGHKNGILSFIMLKSNEKKTYIFKLFMHITSTS